MAKNDVFVDSCGFYAVFDRRDFFHKQAVRIIESTLKRGGRLVLSDYIITESLNLAVARRGHHVAFRMLDFLVISRSYRRHVVDGDIFDRAVIYFRQHSDKDYSFTDCTSFLLMKSLRLTRVLTEDHHFTQAGFDTLLG